MWYATANSTDFREMGQGSETAMAGPMYRYNHGLQSQVKFPPWFDGRLIFWDWSRRVHRVVTLDNDGKYVKSDAFPESGLLSNSSNISMEFGPEGALYVLQYSQSGYGDNNAALYRIEYTGARDETCLPPSAAAEGARARPARRLMADMRAGLLLDIPAGAAGGEILDLQGRRVWEFRRPAGAAGETGRLRVQLPRDLAGGVFQVRYR
jgi:hypothetical protein